jgi:isopenicillin N synthase-like dioxygenase
VISASGQGVKNTPGPGGARDRHAIPFFFDPSPDTVIACLPSCQGPDDPPPPAPILFDDYMQWFSRRNYLHQQDPAE